jgi:hypothetical protein
VFENAGPQPFLDELDDALRRSIVQESGRPIPESLREERPDIGGCVALRELRAEALLAWAGVVDL